jgi:zinc transporter ZupT
MLAVFIVAILSVVGILLMSIREDLLQKLMDALMALSSGALFGAAFIHILPESIEFYSVYGQMDLSLCLIFTAGFVGAMILEMLLEVSLSKISGGAHHHHHQPRLSGRQSLIKALSPANTNDAGSGDATSAFADVETPSGEHTSTAVAKPPTYSLKVDWAQIRPMAYIILVGDLFHNFVDGVLIATAFLACDDGLGIAVTASAILHEVPQEFADFIILIDAGFTVFQAIFFNFVSALSAFLGAFVILAAVKVTKETMGILLGFGAVRTGILWLPRLRQY